MTISSRAPPGARAEETHHDTQCLLNSRDIRAVDDGRSVSLGAYQPRLLEHREVSGERGSCKREAIGELTGAEVPAPEQFQDCSSRRVRECGEHIDSHISVSTEI